ncbi:ABC transporter ATP-binding protein [Actinopolymorpha sp. B17G11]|uniref:ABC transporter ATP-binding protein n=1 Tax=unclassified Actinopolymorpha TaxID=2627063 RepID=UPI0032D96AAE
MDVVDLSLGYGEHLVVDRVDLTIPARTVTAIVGPNGSGKSTLLRGMARLLRPRTGRVDLDGVDIARTGGNELAKRLGLLPQGPLVPEGLTVGDLVGRGRFPHRAWYQRWSSADEEAVRQALQRVELLDLADHPVDQLSGGQRQRAWLAMVLAQDTAYLLLDEPTTYLDLAHAVDVMTVVRSVAHDGGRTVVCVLHDLTLAARFADHIVVLDAGRIAAEGTPRDVLTEDLLRAVFGLTARVVEIDGAPAVVPTRHT